MMLHPNHPSSLARHGKRKAVDVPEGNERLSKRLSLLNLGKCWPCRRRDAAASASFVGECRLAQRMLTPAETSGTKLYVPVESSRTSPTATAAAAAPTLSVRAVRSNGPAPALVPSLVPAAAAVVPKVSMAPVVATTPPTETTSIPHPPGQPLGARHKHGTATPDDDDMHVDDTKYKVYIYNIDDELADDEASSSSPDADIDSSGASALRAVSGDGSGGKLVFLPDIDKHLREAARGVALSASVSAAAAAAAVAASSQKLAVPRPVLPNQEGELAGMQLVLYNEPSSLSVLPENDSVRQAIMDVRARHRERQQQRQQEEEAQRQQQQQMLLSQMELPMDADASMASTPAPMDAEEDAEEDADAMDID